MYTLVKTSNKGAVAVTEAQSQSQEWQIYSSMVAVGRACSICLYLPVLSLLSNPSRSVYMSSDCHVQQEGSVSSLIKFNKSKESKEPESYLRDNWDTPSPPQRTHTTIAGALLLLLLPHFHFHSLFPTTTRTAPLTRIADPCSTPKTQVSSGFTRLQWIVLLGLPIPICHMIAQKSPRWEEGVTKWRRGLAGWRPFPSHPWSGTPLP